MNCQNKHIWILLIYLAVTMNPVNVQFAMPMSMCAPPIYPVPPPPIFPIPAPIPMIAPALCPLPIPAGSMTEQSTTTTTTTTETPRTPETIAVAVPVPVPMPMPMPMPIPMAVPAFPAPNFCQGPPPRPKNCPPCPPCVCKPSCTPSFFSYCSPCHMKCRCKNPEDAPEPMPPNRPAQAPSYGMPIHPVMGPPPVVIVPYPPPIPVLQRRRRIKKKQKSSYSTCSEESTETSSSESSYLRKSRHAKRKRLGVRRRSLRSSESENELVKPMLSYIAENGDVKFNTRISSDDVEELLGEKKSLDNERQTVQVVTREDENNKPNVIVFSKNAGKRKRERYKKVFLRGGVSNHVLDNGKKELIFKPPEDKKISNLSVSFQIS